MPCLDCIHGDVISHCGLDRELIAPLHRSPPQRHRVYPLNSVSRLTSPIQPHVQDPKRDPRVSSSGIKTTNCFLFAFVLRAVVEVLNPHYHYGMIPTSTSKYKVIDKCCGWEYGSDVIMLLLLHLLAQIRGVRCNPGSLLEVSKDVMAQWLRL